MDQPIAQTAVQTSTDSSAYSLEELKQARTAVENAGDITDDIKKSLLSYLDRAILFREKTIQFKTEAADINQLVKTAPRRIKSIEAELNRSLAQPENFAALAAGMTTDQLEQRLRQMKAELSKGTDELTRLTDQLNRLKELPTTLQQEMTDADQRLQEVNDALQAPPPADETQRVTNLRQGALLAEQAKTQAEIELYQVQLRNNATLMALAAAERDLAARSVSRQEDMVNTWQEQVQQKRELEAQKERLEAEQARAVNLDLPPAIQKEFDANIELGKMLEALAEDEAGVADALVEQQARLKQLEEQFALAKEQVQFPVHTETVGVILREQRNALPNVKELKRKSKRRQLELIETRSTQLDLDRQRRELANPDRVIDRILQSDSIPPDADLDSLRDELRQLLSDRRDLIIKLQAGYQRLFKERQELEYTEQQLAAIADKVAEFLDERLFWFRSAGTIVWQDVRNLPRALQWFFSPHNWRQVIQDLGKSFGENPFQWILGLLISLSALGLRIRAHRDLSRVALEVYSVKTDNFFLTLRALGVTFRVVFGWPLLMLLTAWQLNQLLTPQEFTQSVAISLPLVGWTLAAGLFLYELCWKDGIAKAHFKWPESGRKTLRRSLPLFVFLLAAMSFIVMVVYSSKDPVYQDSLGRLAMIVLMGGFTLWFVYKLIRQTPLLFPLSSRGGSWLKRLKYVWYALFVGVPLSLAVLAGMGYYYTAFALYLHLGATILLLLGLVILKDFVLRWVYITQRRIAYEEIKRKREAVADQEEPAIAVESVVVEEPEINLEQLYEKNTALLHTLIFFSAFIGLWMIWENVLPALGFLQNIELWSYTSEVDGVRTTVPITLANLLVAFIVAIVTAVAARNLPALLEMILINWFPLEAGLRHAVSTIFNYTITSIGIVITLAIVGLKWSNIQWLVAALGVGVGFGLQEVVANFICGLIVLFERPYRIGDTVTIGDVVGTVTRIQIRATTIMDWDRKELIVPNKEFITGRLINWSLTDNVIRIRVPVGIAYGSDTEKAEKQLLKAARSNPLVLKSPEPYALFMGFGDNSLNFELRVFINGIKDWIPMLHNLNRTIDAEFRKAGVTISFPQRDVHLDQIGPLEVRVVSGKTAEN